MIKVQTAYMGEIEIKASNILTFEHGLPGFEDENEFVLLELDENSAFFILQSLKTKALAFIITHPSYVTISYCFDLDEATVHALSIQQENEVDVYAIVTLKETLAQSTINLKAPIIVNTTNNKAKQVILNDEQFKIRHPLSIESQKG